MTALNLTITPERAWMSQDTALNFHSGPLPDMADNTSNHLFSRDGIEKLLILPKRRLLVGVVGAYNMAYAWREVVKAFGGDISQLNDEAPQLLAQMFAMDGKNVVREFVAVHAGYSQREKRVIGYAYDFSRSFAPVKLEANHTYTPQPSPEAPDYARLYDLSRDAAAGRQVEAFHATLFANQKWQADNGLLRGGTKLSDSYTLASVDRECAQIATLDEAAHKQVDEMTT